MLYYGIVTYRFFVQHFQTKTHSAAPKVLIAQKLKGTYLHRQIN